MSPRTTADTLVAEALRYGFERPGDIPGRQRLANLRHVPLSTEIFSPEGNPPETLTAHALPAGRTMFSLLSIPDARALAKARGEFSFVTTTRPEIHGDTAYVFIGVSTFRASGPPAPFDTLAPFSGGFGGNGGGYEIRLVRRGGRWVALEPATYTVI